MSWKAGSGRVAVGVGSIVPRNADVTQENVSLPAKQGVLVTDTDFRLVRA